MLRDIRLPIGLLFLLLGGFLAGYGLLSDPAIYARSLRVNLNLGWGTALAVFGAAMTALAALARKPGAPDA